MLLRNHHSLVTVVLAIFVFVSLAACRRTIETPQPTPIVTVLSATAIPTDTALPEPTPTDNPVAAAATLEPEPTVTPQAESAVASLLPGVVAYDLGDTILIQDRFPEDSRFRNMPARLEGIIAVPDNTGLPAPVVLILHGNHPGCPINPENTDVDLWPCPPDLEQPNYQGFDYLVRALADQGYLALSINVNAEYSFGFGEPTAVERMEQLIRDHLNALETAARGGANGFGVDLAGRVDLSRLVLIGHSQGGEFANRLTHLEGWDSPYSFTDNGFGSVDGLLLIAPSFNFVDSDGGSVPLAVILPSCDGDVVQQPGQFYFEALRHDPSFDRWATTSLIEGANHNFFNRNLGSDMMALTECPAPLLAADQQDFLVEYTLNFLEAIWGTQPDQLAAMAALGLDMTQPAPTSILGLPARTVSLGSERLPLFVPSSEEDMEQALSSGRIRLDDVNAIYCAAGFDIEAGMSLLEACRRPNYNQPGQPSQLLVNWSDRSGTITFPLSDDLADVSRYTAISLRAVPDPLSVKNLSGSPQSFTLNMTDGTGRIATAVVPSTTPALQFPAGEIDSSELFADGTHSGDVHMSDIRVPLKEFEGVDLSDVDSLSIAFDQTDSGSVFLADVQFVRPPAVIGAYSTLLENTGGANDDLKAIGRLSGSATCTATFFDTGGPLDAPAYAITNGHCAQPWDANAVFTSLPAEDMTLTFNYFVDTTADARPITIRQVAYSTMKGRDVALLELDTTAGELIAQGMMPMSIADAAPELPFTMRVIGAPVNHVPQTLSYLREESCLATARANLFEFIWHFDDAIRNSCQDIYGGSSGSPVINGEDAAIVALMNTTTVGGTTSCAAGAPCEVTSEGTRLVSDASYATPVIGIDACFTAGVFDLAALGCPLDNGRQLILSGYPTQPTQPTLVTTDGQTVPTSWNTIVSGDLSYYRYKIGVAAETNCRLDSGYGEVIALSNQQRIDAQLPSAEGSHVLCVLAGPTPLVDAQWQPADWATVVRTQIDTTPPSQEPLINILWLADTLSIEPIFAVPELVDFRLKIGPLETTDCAVDEDYMRYRRIPLQISAGDLPVRICVIGSDSAGNEGEPVEHLVYPR